MKKLALAVALVLLVGSSLPVHAQEITCTPVYGGGVICGAHTPVDTGLSTSALFSVSGLLYVAGLILFLVSRKIRRVYLFE